VGIAGSFLRHPLGHLAEGARAVETPLVVRADNEGWSAALDRPERSGDRDLDGDARSAGPRVRRDGAEAARPRLEDRTSAERCEACSCDLQGDVDGVDGAVPVSCQPRPGRRFPLGKTIVRCAATDSSGNTATAGFTVTVKRRR
jgi:hypothetical protein